MRGRGPQLGRFAALACAAASLWGDGASAPAHAGAWPQPEGKGQIIFGPSLAMAGRRFDRRGRPLPTDRFVKQETTTRLDYGWREDVTAILTLVTRGEAYQPPGAAQRIATSGIGAGARVALWREGGTVLSTELLAKTHLERQWPARAARFGPRQEAEARLLLGHGFALGRMDAFVEAQAGWRWRSGRFADEALFDVTFGLRPHPRLLLLLQAFNSAALQPARDGARERPRSHKLQASAVVDIARDWSVQAGVFAAARGRSALAERGVAFGLWRKF